MNAHSRPTACWRTLSREKLTFASVTGVVVHWGPTGREAVGRPATGVSITRSGAWPRRSRPYHWRRASSLQDAARPRLRDCSFALGSCGPTPVPQLDSPLWPRGIFGKTMSGLSVLPQPPPAQNRPCKNAPKNRASLSSLFLTRRHGDNLNYSCPHATDQTARPQRSRCRR